MSIAPEEFVPYMSAAFDGMLAIAEELGDARLNQRPQHMPNTSTPFAILTHCIGLTRYWLGTVIAGRQIPRDRDAEFRARGTVADLRQAVQHYTRKSRPTSPMSRAISPRRFPPRCGRNIKTGHKGISYCSVTKSSPSTTGIWN
jgi:hypothetical protein